MIDGIDKELHFSLFVRAFVKDSRRSRWQSLWRSKRPGAVYDHFSDLRDIDRRSILLDRQKAGNCPTFLEYLSQEGVLLESALAFSQWEQFDLTVGPVGKMIPAIFGVGLGTIVSIVPGKLAFLETQEIKGQYLLKR
jgi:hypothetical protein